MEIKLWKGNQDYSMQWKVIYQSQISCEETMENGENTH